MKILAKILGGKRVYFKVYFKSLVQWGYIKLISLYLKCHQILCLSIFQMSTFES